VNLPALTIAISRGDSLPDRPLVGRPGVRTHSSLALMLGAAEKGGSRAAALRALVAGLAARVNCEVAARCSRPCRPIRCRWFLS